MEKLVYSPIANLAVNVLLAVVWGFFAVQQIQGFIATGIYALLVFCFSETLQAVFFLFRSQPKTVSVDPFSWLVAIGGTFAALCFRPGGAMLSKGGEAVLIVGVVIQIIALLSLNRSFALVAAKREVKTSGLYRFVRHPMYASYVISYAGYLLFNWSLLNLACFGFAMIFMVLRISEEEKILIADSLYQTYAKEVPFRLLPLIY